MALGDITASEIEQACDEYDQLGKTRFLTKYGFGAAARYMLRRDAKHYDSKAILGAAHGFARPDLGPLPAKAFSGGLAETVRTLERLGFQVVVDPPPTRNPDWTHDELVLATEFYRRYASSIPGKTSSRLLTLADDIRAAAALQGLVGNDTFRNPNGVYMKLMELRKYDPQYAGVGLGHERQRRVEKDVWDLPDEQLFEQASKVRGRIAAFFQSGGTILAAKPEPDSAVLRELLASEDIIERNLAETLMAWQDAKRAKGLPASMGREPGQIRSLGARHVIEQRVRSKASGFDLVTDTNQSYEKIVSENPESFDAGLVAIARARLAEYALAAPTEDLVELEQKTLEILKRPEMLKAPPAGNAHPRKVDAVGTIFVRDPRVVAYTQARAKGTCELCERVAPFVRTDGTPFLETHHVFPLSDGGPDTPDNCVAVCPNCHRALHWAANKEELASKLRLRALATFG